MRHYKQYNTGKADDDVLEDGRYEPIHYGESTNVSQDDYMSAYNSIVQMHKAIPEMEITRECIDEASRNDIRKGPIALTLNKYYNSSRQRMRQVRVDQFFTLFGYCPTIEFENRPALQVWLNKYDKGLVVPTVSITLEFNSPLENYVVLF